MSERHDDLAARLAGLSPEKRALLAKRLEARAGDGAAGASASAPVSPADPIAVIGMACRFPGADDLDAFWSLISRGGDAITEVPADRWDVGEWYDADPAAAGKIATRWGGFISGVDRFDAALFGISPREAAQMDPQQRLLLETAWSALEHAGQAPDRLRESRTGVFVGVHSHSVDYALLQYRDLGRLDAFSSTGTAHNFFSGRLSYLLDLRGPSLVVDTACSSSLVAMHLACQSVQAGESAMAIVAGVNVMLTPAFTVAASRMHMLAPDGRCKPFDARADGFVRSEGCGVVVIKRLSQAKADGDRVLALIRGTAINQDGHTNGITAPNGRSQEQVIREALRRARVEPEEVGYVETHGTGTPLGDPIEVEALAAVIGAPRPSGSRVALGSVKANIGHLEGAAGIAGFIKAVLCLDREQQPPVAHFRELNPHVSLEGTAIDVPTMLTPWPRAASPRIAGVSSFGWSGTNAHVVLEEAPAAVIAAGAAASLARDGAAAADSRLRIVPLSARTPEALVAHAASWARWCEAHATLDASDIADSAAFRRAHHEHRGAIVAPSVAALGELAGLMARGEPHPSVATGRARERAGLVFVFPGQGSQWLGMGRQLLDEEPAFRAAIEACDRAFAAHVDWSLLEQLRAGAGTSRLQEIDVVQPMLFAIEVALAALWRAWGFEPDAVVGHSMGEAAAAYVAGALTLDDAARVICRRSQLLRRISGRGAMAMIELSFDETTRAIAGRESHVSIAASNSPGSTVIAGDVGAIQAVVAALQQREVFCRLIKVDVASHSPQVDALAPDLLQALALIRPIAPRIPMCSTVTASMVAGSQLDADYWQRNLRQPVLLSEAVARLVTSGHTTFIEMSPHPILVPSLDATVTARVGDGVIVSSLRREEDERASLLASVAALYVRGCEGDWRAINGGGGFVDLPQYAYQRERFWLADSDPRAVDDGVRPGHAIMGPAVEAVDGSRTWDVRAHDPRVPETRECRFDGRVLMGPAAVVDAALEAARATGSKQVVDLQFVTWLTEAPADAALDVRASAVRRGADRFAFTLQSAVNERPWTTHVTAQLARETPAASSAIAGAEAMASRLQPAMTAAAAYDRLAAGGWSMEGSLRTLGDVFVQDEMLLARFDASAGGGRSSSAFPLAIWQAAFDAATLLATSVAGTPAADTYVPARVRAIAHRDDGLTRGWIAARLAGAPGAVDVAVLDEHGDAAAWMHGIELAHCRSAARDLITQRLDDWFFDVAWQPAPMPTIAPIAAPESRGAGRRWVILADALGVGAAFAAEASARGEQAVVISRDRIDDVADVIASCGAETSGGTCEVIHLWSLDQPSLDAMSPSEIDARLQHAGDGLLRPIRAVTHRADDGRARLWLVTSGAVAAGGRISDAAPMQAMAWGFGRVAAEEHADCWGGLVDLDPLASPASSAAALRRHVLADDQERQVAFRADERLGARVAPLAPRADVGRQVVLRPDATYLITGGLTGVGAAAATWLVEHGARHVVLVGRTALPERRTWRDVDVRSSVGARIAVVRRLEALGATVHAEAFDVADEGALRELWQRFEAEGRPPIRGIIHAAAVIDDALLRDVDVQGVMAVTRPKAVGAWLLHRISRDAELDFFLLCSSLGAILGQTGQASYSAANTFLDALAHVRSAHGLPATSVNWAGWRDLGLAMLSGTRGTIQGLDDVGIASYSTAQGLDALGYVLASKPVQAIPMPLSRERLRSSRLAQAEAAFFSLVLAAGRSSAASTSALAPASASVAAAESSSFRAKLADAKAGDRRNLLERFLVEQVADVLRLPMARIDVAQPMGALGLESLMALELRNRIERRLDVKLPSTVVWNHPTVAALAKHLARRLDLALDESASPAGSSAADGPPERIAPVAPATPVMSDVDELSELDALQALTRAATIARNAP